MVHQDYPGSVEQLDLRVIQVIHGVLRRMISVVILYIFEIFIFCFVVGICDLVHDVETIFYLS